MYFYDENGKFKGFASEHEPNKSVSFGDLLLTGLVITAIMAPTEKEVPIVIAVICAVIMIGKAIAKHGIGGILMGILKVVLTAVNAGVSILAMGLTMKFSGKLWAGMAAGAVVFLIIKKIIDSKLDD